MLLRSVHGGRLHTVVKCNGFVTFVLPFLYIFVRSLISPTGRNFQPIRTLDSSNDVFCFVHVPFRGLQANGENASQQLTTQPSIANHDAARQVSGQVKHLRRVQKKDKIQSRGTDVSINNEAIVVIYSQSYALFIMAADGKPSSELRRFTSLIRIKLMVQL